MSAVEKLPLGGAVFELQRNCPIHGIVSLTPLTIISTTIFEATQDLMILSSKPLHSLLRLMNHDYHTQNVNSKVRLEGEKWFISSLLNKIPNSNHHWIVHDKDPKTLDDNLMIVPWDMHKLERRILIN